jgi:uncharacterized membrane protein
VARLADLVAASAAFLEVAGIAVIVAGTVVTALRVALARGWDAGARYRRFRLDLGKAILLGLELLVGADIVRSVAAPTFEGISVLGLIVVVRTFLSFTLTVELEGRWPWQRAASPPGASREEPPGEP